MTFLSPAVLWGLFAAAIPVLIHLLSLQNTREVEFSSIKFIKALEHETIRRLKLRQWLLVILRTLIVICLVLIFARPVQRGFAAGWSGDQEAQVVLIIDNSASMSAETEQGTLLEVARLSALQTIAVFEGRARIDVYQTNPVRAVFQGLLSESDNIRAALNLIEPTQSRDDLWTVIDSLLASYDYAEPNQECFIFSDFQRRPDANFFQFVENDSVTNNWRLYCVALPDITKNLSIRDVVPLNQVRMPNSLLKMNTSIINDGAISLNSIPVELYLNDERVGQVISDFEPRRTRDFLFQAYPGKAGIISGRLTLPNDDFDLDNKFTFETIIPDEINTLVVGAAFDEIHLLRTALRSIDPQTEFLFVDTKIDSLPQALALDNTDVLIMYNPGGLTQDVIDEITTFLESGGGMIWFSGQRAMKTGSTMIERAFNLPHARQITSLEGESYYSVLASDPEHSLLSDLDLLNLQKELPQVFRYVDVSTTRSQQAVLALDNGRPLLVDLQRKNGRIFYITSLLDLRWNDLALRGLVVPLLHRMLMLLATDESLVRPVEVDQIKTIPLERDMLNRQWELITPSEQRVLLLPDFTSESLPVTTLSEVGSYQILLDGALYTTFSAHLSPHEYPSLRAGEKAVIDRLPANRARWISSKDNYSANLKDIRFGRSQWRTFLIMAIIFMLLETALGRYRPENVRRKSTNVD